MEDGVNEDPTQRKEPTFLGKAGWVKKAPGRLFASYKDRYIHVEKTDIVVYEHEDLQNCLERVDLENYDRCHELKTPLKKRHRLILIRSAKSGNKVSDVKFQTQTAEEKEAWIKALTDAISRAKNKAFDEVKVDESNNLDHVTRTRPKGNRSRRPPTRIHMKEVAEVSCDGILRLDLDLEGAKMPNGTYYANVDGTETPEEDIGIPRPTDEEGTGPKPEVSPQNKVFKTPMPPNKDAKPSPVPEGEPEKKVLKPPMPPSKEPKSCISPAEAKAEWSAEAGKAPHPPNPPSKSKKPSHPTVQSHQEVPRVEDECEEKDGDHRKETTATDKDEADSSVCEEAQVGVERADVSSTGEQNLEEGSEKTTTTSLPLPLSVQISDKCLQPDKHGDHSPTREELHGKHESVLQTVEVPPTSEVPSVVVSLNEPLTDSLTLGPLLCQLPGERKMKAEEKSVDSGQHSDNDSEGSGAEDTLAASTAALRGSQPGLDVLDANEDNIHISLRLRPAATKPRVKSQLTKPTLPLTPSTKVKSASIGDLLSNSSVFIQGRPNLRDETSPTDDVMKLETEVALEMEKTDELLSRVSTLQDEGERKPKDLLTEAMEKLKKADHVLREVRKLTLTKNTNNRKSW
ncbi:pleckstrin homology domain-containing family O member 2 [Solea solea]|uniref:pleckstrin homology domain-containing family O member 2 n=1 Tax=Solea solea TaxID=90069 RepID=UPI00272A6657|nr:pleckstrin homology domain-containing family O member 2 [Solea solea]